MSENSIPERVNPAEKKLVIKTKSVLMGRMKKENDSDIYKTLILRFFSMNNPHKQAEAFPDQVITFTNIEKIRVMGLNVSFYLEGNDIVINDLEELTIEREGSKAFLTGKQIQVLRRK